MIIKSPTVLLVSLCAGLVSSYALASDMTDENQTSSLKRKAPSEIVKIGDKKRLCVSPFDQDETSPDPTQRASLEKEGSGSMRTDHSACVDEDTLQVLPAGQAFGAAESEHETPSTIRLASAAWGHTQAAYESSDLKEKHQHFLMAAALYDSALDSKSPDARLMVCALHAHYDLGELEPEGQGVPHFNETVKLFNQALECIRLPSTAYCYAAKAHIKLGEGSCAQERLNSLKTARGICEDGLTLYPESRNLLNQASGIHALLADKYALAYQRAVEKKG